MKDEFRKRFKQELGKFIKLEISLPVAFGAVWHQTTQTIWLAETDSAALFQELISWAKKKFPSLNKAADRRRSITRCVKVSVLSIDKFFDWKAVPLAVMARKLRVE